MAKVILTILLISLVNVLAGCYEVDSGQSQLVPTGIKREAKVDISDIDASEADFVEHVAISRQAYRNGLEMLIANYESTGNNMMLGWAKDELEKLNKLPQYKYIIEAGIAGAELSATASIVEAEYMYADALQTEEKAKGLLVIYDENLLRVALEKYNRLIKRHPSSDRIDDAAYHAAGIYEYFKDYTIAAIYYQRVYQWNPETIEPALVKAAHILGRRLGRRREALELYQTALNQENLSERYRLIAEQNVKLLTMSEAETEE